MSISEFGDQHALREMANEFSDRRTSSMFEGMFQPTHLLAILFIALLVFGPKKLPELGKDIGAGIRALKEGFRDSHPDPLKSAEPRASGDNSIE
jgi:sec-independent protein translocase protein TatA